MESHRNLKERGISVVGVPVDGEGWAKVRPFAAKLNVNYPMVIGGEELIQQYGGLDSLPTTLIIDRRGGVAVTHIGLVSKQTYESDIERILSEPF